MQIKRLEERLGVELFQRTSAQVGLSPAGEGLLGYARQILSLNAEAIERLREQKTEGVVRLGVMDDCGAVVLPPLLASFVASYPHVQVEMETGLTANMSERLGSGFDLVIAMHPEGETGGELLRVEQAIWAAGALHATEKQIPLPIALYPPGCLFRRWALDALDKIQRPWRLAFVCHSLAAVEAIAAHGLAVTIVKSGTFPENLRRLGERDGMPSLPAAEIRLHRATGLTRTGALLADHLARTIPDARSAR